MPRIWFASAGVVAIAAAASVAADHADIGHALSVFAGIAAAFAWIAFERRSRQ